MVLNAQVRGNEVEENLPQLIQQTAAGDERAYGLLVQQFSAPVYRFLYRMLNQSEDAQDLTQDTFYELYRNRAKLRADVHILPYLFTIAQRKAISLLRWRRVRQMVLPLKRENEETIASSQNNPRDCVHNAHLESRLNRALANLKPARRAVLILRFFEGMEYQEIARIMNKPEGTVKSLAFRAERELREKLATPPEEIWSV
ncbi:MAG: RNA polymerase sigma factor [bacterium]